MSKSIEICVGGLWRVSLAIDDGDTMVAFKQKIEDLTGVPSYRQVLTDGESELATEEAFIAFVNAAPDGYDGVMLTWPIMRWRPIHAAASNGNTKAVTFWVASGADVNEPADGNPGMTPLMAAASELRTEMVCTLLRLGADASLVTRRGDYTALHFLANPTCTDPVRLGNTGDVVRLLVAAGASLVARDERGRTPLDIAREVARVEGATVVEAFEPELPLPRP